MSDAVRIATDRPRGALRAALLMIVVLSPLPFASVESWAILVIELSAAALAAFALVVLLRDADGLGRPARWLLLPAGTLALLGLAQWLPAPSALTRSAAPSIAEARAALARVLPEAVSSSVPSSLSAPDTVDAWLRLVAYLGVGLAAAVAFRSPGDVRKAAVVLAASGVFQAVYGSAEYLSGHQHIFAYVKKHYLEEATGTFINRNHYATYLAMTLPAAMGLLHSGLRRVSEVRGRSTSALALWSHEGMPALLGGLAAVLIWLGIFLSYSRGGLVAGLVAMTVFLVVAPRSRSRARSAALALTLLIPAFLLLVQDLRAPGERFLAPEEELQTLNSRTPTWEATLGLAGDHLVAGSGLGTFESAFAAIQPPSVGGTWDHAHNDWLQTLAEGGVLALGALVALLVAVGAVAARRLREGAEAAGVVALTLPALAALAVSCFVDFPARMPAIAVLAATLVGILGGATAPSVVRFPPGNPPP